MKYILQLTKLMENLETTSPMTSPVKKNSPDKRKMDQFDGDSKSSMIEKESTSEKTASQSTTITTTATGTMAETTAPIVTDSNLAQFLKFNPLETLLALGTPIYAESKRDSDFLRSSLSTRTSDYASHGIIIDVHTDGILPYYTVLKQLNRIPSSSSSSSHVKMETITITHRELINQDHYLNCENIPNIIGATEPFCEICTGRELHPVIRSDMQPTTSEINILLELPPLICQPCGEPIISKNSHSNSKRVSPSLTMTSPVSSSINQTLSFTTPGVNREDIPTTNSRTSQCSDVHMSTPFLGANRRVPCCSLECAIRLSQQK